MKSIRNNCEHNERYKQSFKRNERDIFFLLSVLKRQQIISLLAEMGVLKTSKYAPTYFLNKVNVSPQFFLPLKKFPCKKSKFCFVYVIIM
jgi:hypothetical protein